MIEAYKRLRHAYGFGIHSPFAYELIKTVVTPGRYSYYGYSDIDREILKPGAKVYSTLRKDARFLLRLLVFLRPSELLLPPSPHPVFTTAATVSGTRFLRNRQAVAPTVPGTRFLRNRRESCNPLLLISAKMPAPGIATQHIASGTAILAFNPSLQLREEIKAAMTDGLVLEGKHTFLAIPRPEMAFTYYNVWM